MSCWGLGHRPSPGQIIAIFRYLTLKKWSSQVRATVFSCCEVYVNVYARNHGLNAKPPMLVRCLAALYLDKLNYPSHFSRWWGEGGGRTWECSGEAGVFPVILCLSCSSVCWVASLCWYWSRSSFTCHLQLHVLHRWWGFTPYSLYQLQYNIREGDRAVTE